MGWSEGSLVHWLASREQEQRVARGFGDARAKNHESHKIEKRRPDDRRARRKHAGGNYGSNRIGGVVKAVGEIENQRNEDDRERNGYCRGHHCWSKVNEEC